MTLDDARTALQERGFDELSDTRLDEILNLAKNQFEDVFPFPWLEDTATGTAPLTIDDLKAVLYVVDTSNRVELMGVPAQQVVSDLDPIVATTGQPVVWWQNGANVLEVYPASTSVQLSVRYVKESPELSLDADTPLIPARYHATWVDLAAVRAYLDGDNPEAAAQLRAVVAQDLQAIVSRFATVNRQNGLFQSIRGYSEDW